MKNIGAFNVVEAYDKNGSNTSTVSPETVSYSTTPDGHIPNSTFAPINEPFCQCILYASIGNSRVHIWDLMILIPNTIFLMFLVVRIPKAVNKLRTTSSPIFTAFYAVVLLAAIIGELRCIVAMLVKANSRPGDLTDKVLWLVLRFVLFASELSVITFGLAFGHLESRRSVRWVLFVTFFFALLYSISQGALELTDIDKRMKFQNGYDIFGHGGMLFWLSTSIAFFLLYSAVSYLSCTNLPRRYALPQKRSFYIYSCSLSLINAVTAVGSAMIYFGIYQGFCLVDVATYIYFSFFAAFVYYTFLKDFFKPTEQNILFSYKAQVDDPQTADDDQVVMPHQSSLSHKADSEGSIGISGFNSTHFDESPNPLYINSSIQDLSLNSNYFASSADS